jgi:GNAT superfamily N-acetyltransferase
MFTTRLARVEDAELISVHRHRMFVDSGQADDDRMATVIRTFTPWVRERLTAKTYIGWLSAPQEEPTRIVAGGGLLLMDFPPHYLDVGAVRGYLLNFYVDPDWRGQGLAYKLLRTAVEETQRRGIGVVSLHASVYGKPLYERNGFKISNEMLLRNR